MDRGDAGFFEEFDESGNSPSSSDLLAEIVVREAVVEDADAIGRISAEREGGDTQTHCAAVRRLLEDLGNDRSRLVLVSELGGRVIGFGKVRAIGGQPKVELRETPEGWYLTGVVVAPRYRRRGIGARLTADRLRWIAERSDLAYYFANAMNRVSIALHDAFGFKEVARGTEFAGVSFVGGEGVLFKVDLTRSPWKVS